MNDTSIEAEVKIKVDSLEDADRRLRSLGATFKNTESQIDLYYSHPCRDFSVTDEALRIRKRTLIRKPADSTVNQNFPTMEITFKGAKIDKSTKTRIEYSVGVDNYHDAKAILESLGFAEVASIVKERTFFEYEGITISLDNVHDVGTYIELERVVSNRKMVADAKKELIKLVRKIGYDMKDSIRDSYLEIYLTKSRSKQ